jgi:RecA/RadA recombinase
MGKPFDVSNFVKVSQKALTALVSASTIQPTGSAQTTLRSTTLLAATLTKVFRWAKLLYLLANLVQVNPLSVQVISVKNAQEQGIYVILIDTENALDEAWLHALGVDTSDDKLLKLNMAMIDDVAKMISEFVKEYKTLPEDQRPKVLIVLDSLGMLLTPTDVNQFEAGDLKGDMGRKPKALTALVRNCVNMFGSLNIGLVATNHTYASQDMFDPDDKISGGQGFIYASSIVVAMRKLKLKKMKMVTRSVK